MVFLILVLFIVGIVAILMEAVLPYGVSAAIGSIAIVASFYLAFTNFPVPLAMIYCLAALVVAVVIVRFAIKMGFSRMTLAPPPPSEEDGPVVRSDAPPAELPEVGDIAEVVQPLRPTGTIRWKGQRLSAKSVQTEKEVPKGARVRIEGLDSIFWQVREITDGDGHGNEAPADVEKSPADET